MTVPPTNAEIDAFMASVPEDSQPNIHALQYVFASAWGTANDFDFPLSSVYKAVGDSGGVMWIAGYTDNSGEKHYNLLGFSYSGVGSDSDIEEHSVVTNTSIGGGEFAINDPNFGSANFIVDLVSAKNPQAVPWLYAIKQAYVNVNIRGYIIPAVTFASWTPVSTAVATWVNDQANWATPG